MGITLVEHGDKRYDTGDQKRLYPIETTPVNETIMYDKEIQQVSYIQANIVACFDEWFRSFFEPTYFKYERIKTTVPFSEFKSCMKTIYKKDMPLLVIDPSSIEQVEDSLFGTNMINRFNTVDPNTDNISGKLIYSLKLIETDKFELYVRRNRYRFELNTMIMERTLDRQINTYNMMIMNIRHNSKFLLPRVLLHLLPMKYIINIAHFNNMDYKSDDFMTYINTISQYPIIKRILPNGHYMFFVQMNVNIQVEVPGLPSKDSPEMSDAIEWGARIVDSFVFTADLPSEFMFLTLPKYVTEYDNSIQESDESITYISSYYADMNWPTQIDDYILIKRIDIEFEESDKFKLDIIPVLDDYDPADQIIIKYIIDNKKDLSDIIKVRVYPNGSYTETGTVLNNDGILNFTQAEYHRLYTINIYINHNNINKFKELMNSEHIGTIHKY